MGDPLVLAIIAAAVAMVLLSAVARWWSRRRERAYFRKLAKQTRRRREQALHQQSAATRLAANIVATSSTQAIAGYDVVRQIEAVFTDGHSASAEAVQVLKATAAAQGANAIINLRSERPSGGKCSAHGDAVIVRPVRAEEPADPASLSPWQPPDLPDAAPPGQLDDDESRRRYTTESPRPKTRPPDESSSDSSNQ